MKSHVNETDPEPVPDYGPDLNTPLFERLRRKAACRVPYPHMTGFTSCSVIQYQQGKDGAVDFEVYEEEFKRLGPSAVRFVEPALNGYLR